MTATTFDDDEHVGPTYFQAVLGLTPSYVHQLARDKILVQVGRGKYWRDQSIHNWVKAKRKPPAPVKGSDGNVYDFAVERARKTKAEADAIERKNKLASGEFVPVVEVQADMQAACSVISKILVALPIRIARLAPELPNRALDMIDKEQAKAMTAICDLDEEWANRKMD